MIIFPQKDTMTSYHIILYMFNFFLEKLWIGKQGIDRCSKFCFIYVISVSTTHGKSSLKIW